MVQRSSPGFLLLQAQLPRQSQFSRRGAFPIHLQVRVDGGSDIFPCNRSCIVFPVFERSFVDALDIDHFVFDAFLPRSSFS